MPHAGTPGATSGGGPAGGDVSHYLMEVSDDPGTVCRGVGIVDWGADGPRPAIEERPAGLPPGPIDGDVGKHPVVATGQTRRRGTPPQTGDQLKVGVGDCLAGDLVFTDPGGVGGQRAQRGRCPFVAAFPGELGECPGPGVLGGGCAERIEVDRNGLRE